MDKLRQEFEAKMFEIYENARETGYNPTRYFQMISASNNLIETAITLINSRNPTEGFLALWEIQRLDLTLEALIVKNQKYHILFNKSLIEIAKKRLGEYGYKV